MALLSPLPPGEGLGVRAIANGLASVDQALSV